MTNPTSAAIRADIQTASAELARAREDVALFNRLKAASGEATRLQARCETLTADLAAAIERETIEAREALAATFRNFRVEQTPDPLRPGNVIATAFAFRYERLRFDSARGESVWTPCRIDGFAALPPDLYAYMIHSAADAVPSAITSLAPTLPEAIGKYLMALRKGHL